MVGSMPLVYAEVMLLLYILAMLLNLLLQLHMEYIGDNKHLITKVNYYLGIDCTLDWSLLESNYQDFNSFERK